MKIAFVTEQDAHDIKQWSGLYFHIAKCLEDQGFEVDYLGPIKREVPILYKVQKHLAKIFLKKGLSNRDLKELKFLGKEVSKRVEKSKPDIILSPSSLPIAFLECKQPIVTWEDSTFSGLVNFYPDFSNLPSNVINDGNTAQKVALDNCSIAIYSSEWAAEKAIIQYQIDPQKIKVIPFGANIHSRRSINNILDIIEKKPKDKCNLLFIGVDWIRKGGDVAVKVAEDLNKKGLPTQLSIVGCEPPSSVLLYNFVQNFGFISKATIEGRQKIDTLFSQSHFLLVPSKAEAYGLVFAEASSFGLPSLTTNIGGIPTVVKDGVNGYKFSLEASIESYSTYISTIFNNYDNFTNLSISSFKEYNERLNWEVAGEEIARLLSNLA